MKGGYHDYIKCCRRQCIEVRSADQSARTRKIFFAFIFHFSGWALVAPSRFALQVPDVRGFHVPWPRAAMSFCLPCSNFAHERNTYVHGGVY